MTEDIRRPIESLAARLISLAETDEGIRSELHALARAIAEYTRPRSSAGGIQQPDDAVTQQEPPGVQPEIRPAASEPAEAQTAADERAVEAPARATTWIHPAVPHAEARPPADTRLHAEAHAEQEVDLSEVQQRCMIKAEGARWSVRRQRRLADGAIYELDIEPTDREIIQKGRAVGTYLWMNSPDGPCPQEAALCDLADCFETAASAIALVRGILNETPVNREELESSLKLLAEAQCMLRAATTAAGWEKDADQTAIHIWLRGATWRYRVYISRYMKATDNADPAEWSHLAARIDELDGQIQQRESFTKKRRQLFGQLRYHLGRIERDGDSDHQWEKVITSVDELVAIGLQPSSIELREALLPFVDRLPEAEFPPNLKLVLREIDRFLALRPEPERIQPDEASDRKIEQVRNLLEGRKVALVGGSRRLAAAKALKDAFGLSELNWIASENHESVKTFEPGVADGEVALVLLAIRWSSHSYGDLQDYCDKYGKPLVRLPAGYNPAQVAHQILEQASERLQEV